MARQWLHSGAVERVVDGSAQDVYRVVSDVSTTGERQRQSTRRVEWLAGGGTGAVVGARFRGHNRSGLARWSRVCEVVEAEPGRVFAFARFPSSSTRRGATRRHGGAEIFPVGDRTGVRHSYEITVPTASAVQGRLRGAAPSAPGHAACHGAHPRGVRSGASYVMRLVGFIRAVVLRGPPGNRTPADEMVPPALRRTPSWERHLRCRRRTDRE